MRKIGLWLLAAATVLLGAVIGERFILGTYDWVWGAAGGVAAVLVAVTLSAAGRASSVRLRNERELPIAAIAARIAARALDLLVVIPAVFIVLRSIYQFMEAELSCFWRSPCEPLERPFLTGGAIVALVWVVLYEPVSVALWGRTAGKWAAGIKVVSIVGGAKPSLARSFARVALPAVAGLGTLGAGWLVVQTLLYISAMRDRDRRGWHDKLAGTVVVKDACARGETTAGCEVGSDTE